MKSLTRAVINCYPNALRCGGHIACVVRRHWVAGGLVAQITSHASICTDPCGIHCTRGLLDEREARIRTVRGYNCTIETLLNWSLSEKLSSQYLLVVFNN